MVIILINVAKQINRLDFTVLTDQNVSTSDNQTNTELMIDMPNDTRMEFIHIGKTGGMTIVKSFQLAEEEK